jgi:hypothetical protein
VRPSIEYLVASKLVGSGLIGIGSNAIGLIGLAR